MARTKTWANVLIAEITDLNPGWHVAPPDDLPISFAPMPAAEALSGRLNPSEVRNAGQVRSGFTRFQNDDVLFAKITPSMENGKVVRARNLVNGLGAGSTEFHVVRARGRIEPSYVMHYLLQESFRREARGAMKGVAGQLRVPVEFLAGSRIPLPPLAEQQRIVAAIEAHFSRLDAAVAALRRVQANLQRYRASVLKAACEGRQVPTEAELALREGRDFESAGESLLNAGVPCQGVRWPNGWATATIGHLAELVQYGTSAKTSGERSGVPVLRMGNLFEGKLVLNDLKYLRYEHPEFPELLLKEGDLLFNRTNSPELVGKTAVYSGTPAICSFASYLLRVRFGHCLSPRYANYYFNSSIGRAWVKDVVSQQVGQANVNGTKLRAFQIHVPPLAEQERIVAEVERRLSVVDELVATVAQQLARAERLRQAILKRAFEGRLAPQDPADEPAAVLLQRIRTERAAAQATGAAAPKRRGRPKRAGQMPLAEVGA